MKDLHPLQRPGYQPEIFIDLDPDRILPFDRDRLLGPGVAIIGMDADREGRADGRA
jgi:hypothetical protein